MAQVLLLTGRRVKIRSGCRENWIQFWGMFYFAALVNGDRQ